MGVELGGEREQCLYFSKKSIWGFIHKEKKTFGEVILTVGDSAKLCDEDSAAFFQERGKGEGREEREGRHGN